MYYVILTTIFEWVDTIVILLYMRKAVFGKGHAVGNRAGL